MASHRIEDVINLARYPIDDPDSEAGRALIRDCREKLDAVALCTLDGFLRPEVIGPMAQDAATLLPKSYRFIRDRIAYSKDDQTWPGDHPRSITHRCSYNQAMNYQIPNDSLVRRIYLWPPLMEFIRMVLGYETLHRSDCPHLALTIQLAGNGDSNGWHYDGNDAVFSLLLQAPEAGGEFEYSPYLRSETDENYPGVAQVFNDPSMHALRPKLTPGTLTLFKGDLSLHRVAPIQGDRRRIIALFSYDRDPGQVFGQSYIELLHACPQGAGQSADGTAGSGSLA